MGFLQRTAEGFLDLTGQRVGGKYPTGISDSVVPVMDISKLLSGRIMAVETAASLTSAVGDQAIITVPDNEDWLLFNVACQYVPTATSQALAIAIYLDRLPGSSDPINKLFVGSFDFPTGSAGGRLPTGVSNFEPIHLSSGVRIITEVVDQNVATLAFSGHAGIVKLSGN